MRHRFWSDRKLISTQVSSNLARLRGNMASWRQMKWLPFMLTRVCSDANKQLFRVKVQPLSFHPLCLNHTSTPAADRNVDVAVTRDSETIVCYHPASDVAYELTKPIARPDPTHDSTETHDLVLKSQLNKDILKSKKAPAIEELARMFYTTKHRWYPVGQFHTRRRNRNPPKDR